MRVSPAGPGAFTVEFETAEELRAEHASNLSAGGLRLPGASKLALFSTLSVTLRAPGGRAATVRATVVGQLPDGVALAVEGSPEKLMEALLPAGGEAPAGGEPQAEELAEAEEAVDVERAGSLWDRIRALSRTEKLLLAPKADRSERVLLLQDNDPQVLYALLKNPRVTLDEVYRVAKSSFLSYQVAELILKTSHWIANQDVRVALVHNPKTPPAFALRLLPTLPESELRVIARGAATSMALKTAALNRLQGFTG